MLAALIFLVVSAVSYGADTLRVRVEWGGGTERLWEGTISLSEGTLAEPRPLGLEADEPGSMWMEAGQLMIRQRTVRAYDGVDLLVSAPRDAKLLVQLTATDDRPRGPQIEVPLADLTGELRNLPLDGKENRLVVRRTPGDSLRIQTSSRSMVFAPGETLKMDLSPYLLPLPADGKARIKVQVSDARDQRELSATHHDVRAGQGEVIPLEISLPAEEGVFDVTITAVQSASWAHPVRPSLHWKRPLAERKVQVLVLGHTRPATASKTPRELTPVLEIDPANPHWWEKVKLPALPAIPALPALPSPLPRIAHVPKGPMGNGCLQTVRHALGDVAQLKPSAPPRDVSWEAYWLSVNLPGRPYILEVDYPSDVSQTLGISILEPNAAGALVPIALDSGVDVADELAAGGPPRWAHHRVVFWPRTTTPLVLVTNRREQTPAVYGKIRVLGGWEHLPRTAVAGPPAGERLFAAYMDRPLLPENFSANEQLDSWSGRSLDDWRTFHEAGTRLVEYLQHVGYNGLMISVAADGSAIYPSTILEPTPRYDTGVFFATAQDPMRKDVLEMLLRLFDRESLQLIPSIEFAAPVPALEAIRRQSGPEGPSVEWIGPEGTSWCQTYSARLGLAPYYNLLDPRVQETMLAVARELVDRYGHHASLAGLAVRLSAYGYAQLPGPQWGMDDGTIARFQRDTGVSVPGQGPNRFAARAAFLTSDAQRLTWLHWRAAECHRFYHRLQEVVTSARSDARLYLAGAEMFAGPELDAPLRPTLPRRSTLTDAMLGAGIDLRHFQDSPGLVLLRPECIVPSPRLTAQAAGLELGQMPEADEYFHGLSRPGSLFFHPPQEVRIPSFDQQSPFKPSRAWLLTQAVPSGSQNRRRFVHSLAAMDSQVLVDGGWLLPLGQEDAIRNVAAAYRRLPPIRFATAGDNHNAGSQPATFRLASQDGRTYLYAVNDAPFATTAQIQLEASPNCTLREMTGARQVAPLKYEAGGATWTVDLEPYDLVAVELSEAGVKISPPRIAVPAAAEAALEQRIRQLGARAAALRNPPLLRVLENPGFERPPTATEPVPDWAVSKRLGVTIQTDKAQHHAGDQSVRISSDGPIACLVSHPFDPPTTGRLSMSVWLRLADPAQQPIFRLAVEGKLAGRDYYRFAAVGQPPGSGQPGVPIGTHWGQYIFQVDDLPLEGLSRLRVRLDLMGQGDVWADDVQLFDLAFNEMELRALYKLITMASVTLQNGQVGDCMKLLDGYWPRFLMQNVPLAPAALAVRPDESRPPAEPSPAPPQQTGWLDRIKGMLPEQLR